MEEFLRENYSILTYSFILVAVVSGFICYNKFKGTPATFFIKIIIYLFLVDFIGSYSSYYKEFEFLKPVYNSLFIKNYWWFTLFFDIGAVVLFSILFQKVLKVIKHIKLLRLSTFLFMVFSLVYLILNHDTFFFQYFPVIQILGALIIIICVLLYFLELLQSSLILKFYESIFFYIAIAIFVWWIIITPIVFYDFYFRKGDWNLVILQWQIFLFANFFMYTTFAIGLIISKPEKIKE